MREAAAQLPDEPAKMGSEPLGEASTVIIDEIEADMGRMPRHDDPGAAEDLPHRARGPASARRASPGTTIGMSSIKRRRSIERTLNSHPDLHVGDCVPFYFRPRSVMLFLLHMRKV